MIRFLPLLLGCLLIACTPPIKQTKTLAPDHIATLIPNRIDAKQKTAWADDMVDIFISLGIPATKDNVCAVIAIIDQESNFVADPAVPNLGKSALSALDDKLEAKLGGTWANYFRQMLNTKPTQDNSFAKQIKQVKTERELDELFREMVAYFADTYKMGALNKTAKLLNSGIDDKLNPVTTLGSMQVHIDYAKAHRRASMDNDALRDDLYSRYGGMYYGIHRLLSYKADYDDLLYRFADYNSGVYSSRNAAFQSWLVALGGADIALDGDLLLYDDGKIKAEPSQSEVAFIEWANSLSVPDTRLTPRQIRQDFKKEKQASFEQTLSYQTLKNAYEQAGNSASYAIMPQVTIKSAKLKKDYNTHWYATNVNKRYKRCQQLAKKHAL